MPWSGVDGARLRAWRLSEGLSETELAIEFRHADPTLPDTEVLAANIRRWETGVVPRWPGRRAYLRRYAPDLLGSLNGTCGDLRALAAELKTRAGLIPGPADIEQAQAAILARPGLTETEAARAADITARLTAAVCEVRDLAAELSVLFPPPEEGDAGDR